MKRYPEYKDSGIEWIGKIPKHWELIRFKYIAKINPTLENKSELRALEELVTFLPMEKVYSDGSFEKESMKPIGSVINGYTYFEEDDVIFAKITPCFENGKGAHLRHLKSKIGFGSTEFHVLRALPDRIIQRFIYYITLMYPFRAVGESYMAGVAGQKRVPGNFVSNYIISLPPKYEQNSIVEFLDQRTTQIDELIDKKQRLIELLKEQRAAMINRAVTKGLNPNAPMKDSGIEWLGKIPEHWEIKKLKYLLKSKKGALKPGPFGSQLKNSDITPNGYKVYNQRSVLDNDFDSGDFYISEEKFNELIDFEIFPNDLLITSRGTIGKCAIFPENKKRGILHPCIIRIQLDQNIISNYYAEYFMQESKLFKESILIYSNATTIEVIYSDILKNVLILLPPTLEEQIEIVEYINDQAKKIDQTTFKLEIELELLKKYRTALISEVVTGKSDVQDSGPDKTNSR